MVMPVGERLRALRKEARLTQGELGGAIGLSQSMVSKVERDAVPTGVDTIEAWIARCGGELAIFSARARGALVIGEELRELDHEAADIVRALARRLVRSGARERSILLSVLRGAAAEVPEGATRTAI